MNIKEALVKFHRAVSHVVLGRKNVELDAACKEKSEVRRKAIEKQIEELEQRTSQICLEAGVPPLVAHGNGK